MFPSFFTGDEGGVKIEYSCSSYSNGAGMCSLQKPARLSEAARDLVRMLLEEGEEREGRGEREEKEERDEREGEEELRDKRGT